MKVTSGNTNMRIKRRADITEGHPTIAMAYARPPKTVVVDHVEIEYVYKNGDWVVDSVFSVDISGVVLKKDGEPSKNRHSRNAPSKSGYDKEEPAPWLDEIVEILRPRGELSMVTLREHEL
jgi:hypothetical protein